MFENWRSIPKARIDTLIGEGTQIIGDISFIGGLRLDGEVSGNIKPGLNEHNTLVLGETGRVQGEIRGTHLMLNGVVIGDVRAEKYLGLQDKARITGDVHFKTIEIQLGAILEGVLVQIGAQSGSGTKL